MGTVWRFITETSHTLVVVPLQTPDFPAPNPGMIPNFICSSLQALGLLAESVKEAYWPRRGAADYEDFFLALGLSVFCPKSKHELQILAFMPLIIGPALAALSPQKEHLFSGDVISVVITDSFNYLY